MAFWFEKLAGRALLEISGEDAGHFLENLVTCKTVDLEQNEARFGALLTPQGKILFDFFLIKQPETFLIDTSTDLVDNLLKRLTFYKLRAKVEIKMRPDLEVAWFQGPVPEGAGFTTTDPRHASLNDRAYGRFVQSDDGQQYDMFRVQNCVPEGGTDFEYGDAYPHETLMDQFGGVDFRKGCYVGQEVVSRMQHRGTAKKRVVKIRAEGNLPGSGTQILADGKPAGTMGTVCGKEGLSLVRLDRIAKVAELKAGDMTVTAEIPEWVNFGWPETT